MSQAPIVPAWDARERLREVFGEYRVPTLPPTIIDALDKLRDEDAAMADVAAVVGRDGLVGGRVLKTANSAAFCLRHPVTDLRHAVTLLGRDELEAILISVAARAALPAEAAPGYEPLRFWLAAARRATLAKVLGEIVDPGRRAVSFTAALLQDVALAVAAHHGPTDYERTVARWHRGAGALHDLERAAYGWDHAEIGGAICTVWGLPALVTESVRLHHGSVSGRDDPDLAPPLPAAALVAPLAEVDDGTLASRTARRIAADLELEPDEAAERISRAFDEAASLARELGA